MKLKLTVDGMVYEVDVEVSEPQPLRPSYVPPAGGTAPPSNVGIDERSQAAADDTVADESKVCRSPISGVVVRVTARPGQDVEADDELMVLEAMKMETAITSPIAGKISRINATAGDPVQTKQVLVEFE